MKSIPLCLSVLVGLSAAVQAENWPQWRGPQGNGVALPGSYPAQFSPEENLIWKVDTPGTGSSTPAVWGERIFVTAGVDGKDTVLCYDWSGKELWRQTLGDERKGKHKNGSGSNPSPVTDGESVFVYYKSGTLAKLGVDGKVLWKQNLQDMYGEDNLWWDLGTSPVLAEGKVIVAVMQDSEGYLAAFDTANGSVAWKTERVFETKRESDQSYCTPILAKENGETTLITWGADHLTSHRASDGKLLWTCAGFNPRDEAMWRTIASPAITEDIALVPYGRGKYIAAVQLGGSGDVTETKRLWESDEIGSDVPTPVGVDGKFYVLADNGELACFEAETGKELWKTRMPRDSSKYYASPVLAGDRLYCAREDGIIMSGTVTDKGFKLLAENNLGEGVIATPVVIKDRILVRGREHLFCFGTP